MRPEDLTGKKAPAISLPDQDGVVRTLKDYKGKWVLVYFYPKDFTPGCTVEACTFRDRTDELTKVGIVVIGISKDSVALHKKFVDAHKLPFTLLSDESKEVMRAYGAWGVKKMMGREYEGTYRYSYLVDPKGVVRKAYTKVKPAKHAEEVLTDVASLKK